MTRPGWMIDEMAHAGDEHLDPAYVAAYDAKSQTDPSADVALLQSLGMDAASTVVDLGAGTGTFALAVAPHVRRVVAVDVSPAMLGILRANLAKQGLANVEPVHAGLLSSPRRPSTRHPHHLHLPTSGGIALARIAAMLRPGGILRLHDLVYSFDPADAPARIEAWLANAPTDPAQGFTRADLELHVRTEHSTYTWLLESLLERAGFAIQQRDERPSGTFAAYLCVKR